MEKAAECCRLILQHVNQAVRDSEDMLVSKRGPGQGRDRWGPILILSTDQGNQHPRVSQPSASPLEVTGYPSVSCHLVLTSPSRSLVARPDPSLSLRS